MHIENITLENFKGFDTARIEFHRQMNVFVGSEHSGKSTLLHALAVALSWLEERIKYNYGGRGTGFPKFAIRLGQERGHVGVLVDSKDVNAELLRINEGSSRNAKYEWVVHKYAPGDKKAEGAMYDSDFLAMQCKKYYDHFHTVPVLAYYRADRRVENIVPKVKKNKEFHEFTIYDSAMKGIVDFQTLFEWLRYDDDIFQKYKEAIKRFMQNKWAQGKDPKTLEYEEIAEFGTLEHSGFLIVRQAIETVLPDYANLNLRRRPRTRLEITRNDQVYDLSNVPEAEKNLIALVADIARRLTLANPEVPNPLLGQGFILIDEVDQGLGLRQAINIPVSLSKIFPNCQFFLSSENNYMKSKTPAESIFTMKNNDGSIQVQRGD